MSVRMPVCAHTLSLCSESSGIPLKMKIKSLKKTTARWSFIPEDASRNRYTKCVCVCVCAFSATTKLL